MAGMLASYNWLLDYLPGVELDACDLGAVLTDLGIELEGLVEMAAPPAGVVAAKVLALREHPNADRMQIVDVDAGDGEALQICCGAFNMSVGDIVPLATIGTQMPGGWAISRAKKRGEWSNGMLCAADEIGLADGSAGILILGEGTPLGVEVAEAIGVRGDWRLELNVTPNRPDCLSMLGLARDLAAKLGVDVRPGPEAALSGASREHDAVDVSIAAPDLCGRFTAVVVDGFDLARSSPPWLARRLATVGQRPINGIVDLSNYVMFDVGQPNHTYDLDAVRGSALGVRWARDGERLVTLDGVERSLTAGDGVIVDGGDGVVGLAGVMGGASTEISAESRRVLLELAWWRPAAIARSAAAHKLGSEASKRFEKGVDPEVAWHAAGRFCQLAADLYGARVDGGAVVVEGQLPERASFAVRPRRVNSVLRTELDSSDIAQLIAPLGFEARVDGEAVSVVAPSWRPDVGGEIDVVEEVARLVGYDALGKADVSSAIVGGLTAAQRRRRAIHGTFVANGVTEVAPMPFLAPGQLEACGVRADAVRIANPLDAAESVLRTSLLPGLLHTLAYNASHRASGLWLFEMGRCFALGEDGPIEWSAVTAVLAGAEFGDAWRVVRRVLDGAGVRRVSLANEAAPGFHPGRAARIEALDSPGNSMMVGHIGFLHPDAAAAMDVAESVVVIDLDPAAIDALDHSDVPGRPVSRFPSSDVDLAFVVENRVSSDDVARTLELGELVVDVELFDVFRGRGLGDGVRSLAFRVRLQAEDRTLTDAELSAARAALVEAVTERHGARLRA